MRLETKVSAALDEWQPSQLKSRLRNDLWPPRLPGASDLKASDGCDYRKDMPPHHRIGWFMFVVSAVLFGISGVRSGDVPVIIGSAVFGVACLAFLKS